uniref:DNA-3-methyladenine glycosylase I n=1 Tax=Leersia perrieri TaxID=77586 RepID=A0A0D9V6S2_9ORYZ
MHAQTAQPPPPPVTCPYYLPYHLPHHPASVPTTFLSSPPFPRPPNRLSPLIYTASRPAPQPNSSQHLSLQRLRYIHTVSEQFFLPDKMCNSNVKSAGGVAQIDGRPVLQPAGNRVAAPDGARPLKKSLQKSLSMPASLDNPAATTTCTVAPDNTRATDFARALLPPPTPASINAKATRVAGAKMAGAKAAAAAAAAVGSLDRSRKPAKTKAGAAVLPVVAFAGLEAYEPAGSIAAAQREHAAMAQAQRKMRIAHYGRTASFSRVEGKVSATATGAAELVTAQDEKRCSFITPYSDPLYVAYHDEEWGVPVHDDELLFEMLTLSGVQVGADWTSILKRRHIYREAFSGFSVDAVAKYTEKQMASLSAEYGLDLGTIRGAVNNACRITEVRKDFGSFSKYVWAFVNNKPLSPSYKYSRKIPVKTSKSETISKDMVRRGFRFVGPTVIHSFMQAVGLTNDHLVSCPRHRVCSSSA